MIGFYNDETLRTSIYNVSFIEDGKVKFDFVRVVEGDDYIEDDVELLDANDFKGLELELS